MKKTVASIILFTIFANAIAQKASVTWGEEYKLKKGSTDLAVVHVDKTGIFVKESHFALKSYFLIGATMRESSTLIKLDNNFTEQYTNDFNKELKGKEFENYFFLKDKLFILATDYSKKNKTLTLFGAEINKSNGELAGDWIEITNWIKEDKKDDIYFKPTYNYDSSKMVLVSTIEGKEKNSYEIKLFDEKLKQVNKPILITNEFEKNLYQIEDLIYTSIGNIVVVGREFEYQEGKKQKSKYLDFKNYNVRIYNNAGKQIKEINTSIEGKWLMSTKVMQTPAQELVLAAFYSKTKKAKEVTGIFLQRINAADGNVISSAQEEINTKLITNVDDGNDENDKNEETKEERKEREKLDKIKNEEDGFSKFMRFRNFVYTEDNGIVILAEEYNSYSYTSTSYNSGSNGAFGNGNTTRTYQVYECENIMMTKIDVSGNINWFHILPKNQREVIQTNASSNQGGGISFSTSFFRGGYNWPFYAGFGLLPQNNSLIIVFNDNKKNSNVLKLGQTLKATRDFRSSECFGVTLNTLTGKYTRVSLFDNKGQPTAMPRLGSVFNNSLYLIGKEDRLFGKTKIAVGRISIK